MRWRYRLVAWFASLCLVLPAYGVVEAEKKSETKNIIQSTEISKYSRVRIPIKLAPYHKVLLKDGAGEIKEKYISMGPQSHFLRARIEIPNHFYVKGWHIESQPEKWDKKTGFYQVALRFYQLFGQGDEVEELVGSVRVNAMLSKEGEIYSFKGYSTASFKDRMGNDLLSVDIGHEHNKIDNAMISKYISP